MTLVEFMVGITIGLIVILAAVGSLVFVRNSSRTMDDSAALQQQATLAMLQIGQQLSQSGSYNAYVMGQDPNANTSSPAAAGGSFTPTIVGGNSNAVAFDTRPAGVGSTPGDSTVPNLQAITLYGTDGASPVSDTLYISYAVPNDGSPAVSCSGQPAAPALTGGASRVISILTAAGGSLTCSTNDKTGNTAGNTAVGASTAALPIVTGVVDMRLKYLIVAADGSITYYKNAQAVNAANVWGNINGVQICLEMVGDYTMAANQTSNPSTGNDCQGTPRTWTDGHLHRIVRNTFFLRNSV